MIIRAAEPDDAAGIATVHVRSWQHAYRGLLPQDVLEGLSIEQRTAGWGQVIDGTEPPRSALLVAVDADAVVGFVHMSPVRDEDLDPVFVGEVTSIYVLPDVLGTGVGRQLMAGALGTLREAGYAEARLWVLADNERAIGFYGATGWAPDGASKLDEVAGTPVTELRYRRPLP